jgi:hypothetical protein
MATKIIRYFVAVIFVCWLAIGTAHCQQGLTNTFNVSQFSGSDVGTKLTNAQAQCLPLMPCVLELDPVLSVYPQGTLPVRCSTCVWIDYRTSGSVFISSATSPFTVDGTTYKTIQAAITAACSVGGGTVVIPFGQFAAPATGFTLCSNLRIVGSARGQADAVVCPTLVTAPLTSGNLFPIAGMTDIYIADFCVKGTAIGGNDVIQLNYGQRVTIERLFIFANGGFLGGIHLMSSSTALASTIWNTFRDIHINGIAALGFGCALESSDATGKVINNNNFYNVSCTGGTGGLGLKMTGSNTVVNENGFYSGGEFLAPGGTAVSLGNSCCRNVFFSNANVEGSANGFVVGTGVSGVVVASNVSANGNNSAAANVTDNSAGGIKWLANVIGGIVQNWQVSTLGDQKVNSICIGAAGCQGVNTINGVSGWAIMAAGGTVATVDQNDFTMNKQLINFGTPFASLGTPVNGTQIYCSDCNATCTAGASTGRTCFRENGAWTH